MTDQVHALDACIQSGNGWSVTCKCEWASIGHADKAEALAALAALAAHCDAPDDGRPSLRVYEV